MLMLLLLLLALLLLLLALALALLPCAVRGSVVMSSWQWWVQVCRSLASPLLRVPRPAH